MTDLEKKFEGKIQNLRKIEILLKLYERYIFLGLINDKALSTTNFEILALFTCYSRVPNKRAARLLIFSDFSFLHALIRDYTIIKIPPKSFLHVYSDLQVYSFQHHNVYRNISQQFEFLYYSSYSGIFHSSLIFYTILLILKQVIHFR